MARKAVRLSDIAEKLGVSTVTVSNALANQRGVSERASRKKLRRWHLRWAIMHQERR